MRLLELRLPKLVTPCVLVAGAGIEPACCPVVSQAEIPNLPHGTNHTAVHVVPFDL